LEDKRIRKITEENLEMAINGETHEEEMYSACSSVVRFKGKVQRVMVWALQGEKSHAGIYQKAARILYTLTSVLLWCQMVCLT
jgi:rubrerythrin